MWKETVVVYLRYFMAICLEGLRKTSEQPVSGQIFKPGISCVGRRRGSELAATFRGFGTCNVATSL
jgi:hypothetical protein